MRIAVIGPLEVLSDDSAPVPVPGAKERLLLAVLAAGAPGVVSIDRIDQLTLAGYLAAGGVAGALTRSAEGAYDSLDEPGRELARRLLVRLADVDGGGALVRRPVPLAELDLDGEGGAARREVVATFVDRRLLSVDGQRLEVAHEALLTGWPRLATWLADDVAGRAVRRQLAPSARAWADGRLVVAPTRSLDPTEQIPYLGGKTLDWTAVRIGRASCAVRSGRATAHRCYRVGGLPPRSTRRRRGSRAGADRHRGHLDVEGGGRRPPGSRPVRPATESRRSMARRGQRQQRCGRHPGRRHPP